MDGDTDRLERTATGWAVSRCTSPQCAARIVWARTDAGKNSPYDAEPSQLGTTELKGRGPTPQARYIGKADREGRTDLHLSHFATCESVTAYRRIGRTA